MSRRLRPWVKKTIALIPVITGLAVQVHHQTLPDSGSASQSSAEEYVIDAEETPRSLADWKKINEKVKYVLTFNEADQRRVIPVIATPDAAYALTHNVYKEADSMGTVFCDPSASEPANLVIYGHSSKTKDWCFTFLRHYVEKDYYDTHPMFVMESAAGVVSCRIVSAGVYDLKEETPCAWADPNPSGEAEIIQMFKDSVPYLKQKTAGEVYEGGGIVTLVTCDMNQDDARIVIQAVKEL